MSKQAYWMWYPGDYEIHHHLKLSCRREERGFVWPAVWRLDDCWHNVRFRKQAELTRPETVKATGNGLGYLSVDRKKVPYGVPVTLEPGIHLVEAAAAKPDGLPGVYIEGDVFASGGGWEADHMVDRWVPAAYGEAYASPEDDPEAFPFAYEEIAPVAVEETGGGILYDFGRQTFAQLLFGGVEDGAGVPVFYGESRAEALDTAYSYIRDRAPGGAGEHVLPARAFRYLFIPGAARYTLRARYEYLALEYRGSFRCSDDRLNRIWETAAYTFHLNSREFFLDGIKRDRWVWSGDAYQSYLISYYLFFDLDIVRRTTLALRGKEPTEQHLNTILDYSFYWVMGIGDYYRYTGDLAFVRMVWPKVKTLLEFCGTRRNAEGFVEGKDGDWTFIDWADIDKTGAVCAEQMLYVKALETAADCAGLLGEDGGGYRELAGELRGKIDRFYWDGDRGAYIDSYRSGRRSVTRHANIFAILLGFADEGRKQVIIDRVLKNSSVPPITTPYFKFYELEALCATGEREKALEAMGAYWGGMLDLGATTVWEEYDPAMELPEHYAMYGDRYGKSLCHAWGASPIYLLGRYFLGVAPTSAGYATFECAPHPAGLEWMEGAVPLGEDGTLRVSCRDGVLRVETDREGGRLVWKDRRYPLRAGEPLELPL